MCEANWICNNKQKNVVIQTARFWVFSSFLYAAYLQWLRHVGYALKFISCRDPNNSDHHLPIQKHYCAV